MQLLGAEREDVPRHQELLDRCELALRVGRGECRFVEQDRRVGRVRLREAERENQDESRDAHDDAGDQNA
jgi:hypothetical protein